MKINIRVNISGRLFNMDEDAYELLQDYLQKLEAHFENMPGGREIIEDIESGIADMLNSKLSDQKNIINREDVQEVTLRMGEPGEIFNEAKDEDPGYNNTTGQGNSFDARVKRKLHRDSDNAVIAGVAAGLSKYFNLDVSLVRALFVILSLLGGPGILIYIVLWIAVPEARTTKQKLEMEGESITIDNIEKKIREELDKLSNQLNDLKNKHFKKKRQAKP